MTTRSDAPSIPALAQGLAATFPGCEDAPLARALLAELARGEPVPIDVLAAATVRRESDVANVLARWPNVQRDDRGRVVAFGGLSLRPTPHRFRVDGRQLYTWCAWDTLFLPALLDQTAYVQSTCPATGATVSLTVGQAGVLASEPQELLVSFPPACCTSTDDIVASFCCHVHFLAGRRAARGWLSKHNRHLTLSVGDAFELGWLATRLLAQWCGDE